jgi:uncharacterized protein YjbI with pentapeptide repeats
LLGVVLPNAKLAGVDLGEALVQGGVFLEADLSGANLAGAYVENTAFNGASCGGPTCRKPGFPTPAC